MKYEVWIQAPQHARLVRKARLASLVLGAAMALAFRGDWHVWIASLAMMSALIGAGVPYCAWWRAVDGRKASKRRPESAML